MRSRNNFFPVTKAPCIGLRIVHTAGILLLLVASTFGQDRGITIEGDDLTLKEAFEQIEAQSSYTIAYNMSRLDSTQKRSFLLRNAGIDEVLRELLQGTGWSYYIEENHIIMVQKKEPAKKVTQRIRGRVYDKQTRLPLPFAAVRIRNERAESVLTDEEGFFEFTGLPPGRYDLRVSCLGYESFLYNEIILISGNMPFVEIGLIENPFPLDEVVITSPTRKEQPFNPMILAGGRMISAEESSRFAGGFDDPARLVTSLAGVEGSVGDNSVIIHGYAPHLLGWRLEGMEIANPNHFADLTTMGGGIFSALSSEVLGSLDFLTGAYPAEYGNALSGIFDMQLRQGNNLHHQYSIEAGIIGVNVAAEGPLSEKKEASYLFHYRNATFALIKNFIPDMEINNFGYQDPLLNSGSLTKRETLYRCGE
ncbi:MAG: carboxypeptidase regulatory-like domain-containing protein [Bacteroides sp.]|nr:carboxypeptidase regulatory-like domain-containing protein [Bacteroides sp.]